MAVLDWSACSAVESIPGKVSAGMPSMPTHPASAVLQAEEAAAFCEKWKVSELYVFGSAARATLRTDSDVDLAVRFRPDVRYSLFDLVDMKDEFALMAGRPVDLFTLRGIEHMPNVARRESILGSLELIHVA